jgi:phospholipase/carboxylesterase
VSAPPDRDPVLEGLGTGLPAILGALDVLGRAQRHLHPPHLPELAAAVDGARPPLEQAVGALEALAWPEPLHGLRDRLLEAGQEARAALAELVAAPAADDGPVAAWRALRRLPRAQEALYPLAAALPPVNRYFLTPAARRDDALVARLQAAEPADDRGVLHAANGRDERGGFSLYVPETAAPDRPRPLVVALHGGSGHGRAFLWSWLAAARSHEAILLAPTSSGPTWSLDGPERDHAALVRAVARLREHYAVRGDAILLTGMSDGGTFAWLSGFAEGDAPWTHVAPVAASFHPSLLAVLDPGRLARVPVYLVHGALDWMFPVTVAREAAAALRQAGVHVTYRELPDLSHAWPGEEGDRMLRWLTAGDAP